MTRYGLKLRAWLLPLLGGAGAVIAAMIVAITPAPAANLDRRVPVPKAEASAPMPVQTMSWTGFYIGLHAGYEAASGELSGPNWGVDGLSATGKVGGICGGADWQPTGTPIVLGGRGCYTWRDVDFTAAMGNNSFTASIKDGWSGDGRIGVALGSALPYLFVGYGESETAATGVKASPDLKGWRYGGGVEFGLPKMDTGIVRPTLSIEGMFVDNETLAVSKTVKLDVDEYVGMARLNLRFFDGMKPAR